MDTDLLQRKRKFHVVSFGSHASYQKLARRTVQKVCEVYTFARPWVLGPSHLSNLDPDLQGYARQYPKGFGYWRWKPSVAEHLIAESEMGDLVVYVDARSGVSSRSVRWIDRMLEDEAIDFSAWRMSSLKECCWTSADLLAHFGLSCQSGPSQSGQFAATFFAFRVSGNTVRLIRDWGSLLRDSGELCRDGPYEKPNPPCFVENRYDQSVLSLLLKTRAPIEMNLQTILDSEVLVESSIYPHARRHPRGWRNIVNRLKTTLAD